MAAFEEWKRDNPSLLAAAIAYYSFFALIPLLVIITAIGSFFLGQEAIDGQLVSTLGSLFGEKVSAVIQAALVSTYTQQSSITVAAAAGVIIFGASFVFVQLRNAFNIVWGVEKKKKLWIDFIEGRLISLVMVTVLSLVMLLWLTASASISAIVLLSDKFSTLSGIFVEIANFVLLFLTSTVLFATMYKLLPSVKLTWEDVGLGAMVTGLLFTAGSHLVALYLSRLNFSSLYGVAGSVVLLMVWLYISAQLFLFGVIFTKVFAARQGSHRKKPRKR